MKRHPLVFLSGLLLAPQAFAAAVGNVDEPAGGQPAGPVAGQVHLAQTYDFDVYIDQYGREIIVDPRTGRVVEIRAPALQPPPPPPVPEIEWRSRARSYDFTDPRDLERFHRDREAAIRGGRGGGSERFVGPRDRYDAPLDPYEEYDEYDYDGLAREQPDYGGFSDDYGVSRAPLPPPSEHDSFASVPPGEEGIREPREMEPLTPRNDGISVPSARGASEDVAAFQVLLDRVGASPGVIDGRIGDNVNKAIDAYREIAGQRLRTYDKAWIEAELERTGGPAFKEYTITPEDVAGPYVASVPEDYGEKAKLERLSFTRVSEMLAERFHMDEKYLLDLNRGLNFNRPGTIIRVANPGKPDETPVARIVADKSRKQVRAYDEGGRLLAAYPATIGSVNTPSPSGTHEVTRVAFNPNYTYDPNKNFKQGDNDRVLTIPPGPNGPVGSVWIALSKPTYGIHGTPEPSQIGKTYSNGCVRLTNWDAEELAKRVKPSVTVEFVE
ncbi:L,D-transpeptidase [Chelativorans sp. Marseille-P2723]|uniref:L,D-transpeptidase n=1 Tax=Chelativorans sp. Marseille-P2723 TaxID=2709133 RepID=UPI00156ECA02|nr:L,D-transpeptidase [Chelativorans sp. Marseille-P2723]